MDQIEDAADRVRDFYRLVAELQGLLGRAEENLNAQGLVGTEVEMIKQQLQEFKVGLTGLLTWMCAVCVCVTVKAASLQPLNSLSLNVLRFFNKESDLQ